MKKLLFIFIFTALLGIALNANPASASDTPVIQIPIPDLHFTPKGPCPDDPTKTCVKWTGEYIVAIYRYSVGIVGILSAVILMYGGFIWLSAGGNAERIGNAKSWITASLSGLVLILTSYMILYIINPDLTSFGALELGVNKSGAAPTAEKSRLSDCQWASRADDTCKLLPGTIKTDGKCNEQNRCVTDNAGARNCSHTCCCKLTPIQGCVWSNTNITGHNCADQSQEKTPDCGSDNPSNYNLCCCPSAKKICEEKGLAYPEKCNDCSNCGKLSDFGIKFKDGDQASNGIIEKLKNVPRKTDWIVSEAWPPEIAHRSPCHANGTCIDIALRNPPIVGKTLSGVEEIRVIALAKQIEAAGLQPIFELPGDCPTSLSSKITCRKIDGVFPHFHVSQ